MSDEDQAALLSTVYNHLEPGGRLIFEMRNPAGTDLSDEGETAWGQFIDSDGNVVKVSGTQTYDAERSIMHWVTFRDWGYKRTHSRIDCRFTTYAALTELLTRYGFRIEHQYADWDRTPFTPPPLSLSAYARNRKLQSVLFAIIKLTICFISSWFRMEYQRLVVLSLLIFARSSSVLSSETFRITLRHFQE